MVKRKKKKFVKIKIPNDHQDESMVSKLAWKTDPWANKIWIIFILIICLIFPLIEILSDLFNQGLYKK